MSEGLELSVRVTGEGGPPANITATEQSLVRLKNVATSSEAPMRKMGQASRDAGDSFISSDRHARLMATGLTPIVQIAPELASSLQDMTTKSHAAATALHVLGVAGVTAGGFLGGLAIGQRIRDFVALRGEFDSVQEAIEHVADAHEYLQQKRDREMAQHRAYIQSHGALQQSLLNSRKATIEAAGAAESARLRGPFGTASEDALRAIDVEKKAKLDALAIVQEQEEANIRKSALTAEGRANADRALAASQRRFDEERNAIETDFENRRTKGVVDLGKLQQDQIQAIKDAQQAADDAERDALAERLANEGRLGDAARVRLDKQIADVRAAADKEIGVWRDQLARQQIDWATFQDLRAAKTSEVSQRIVGLIEKERQTLLRSVQGPTLFGTSAQTGERGDLEARLSAAEQAASAAFGRVLQPPRSAAIGAGDLSDVRAQVDAWADYVAQVNAAKQARIDLDAVLNRPQATAGFSDVRKLEEEARAQADFLGQLKARGVLTESDVVEETQRSIDALNTSFDRLRTTYATTPAVLAEIDRAQRALDFGGFLLNVQRGEAGMGALDESLRAVGGSAATTGGQMMTLRGIVGSLADDMLAVSGAARQLGVSVAAVTPGVGSFASSLQSLASQAARTRAEIDALAAAVFESPEGF